MPSARLWGRGNSVQPPFFPKMGLFFIPLIFIILYAFAFWSFFGQHVSPNFLSSGRSVPAWKVFSSVFFGLTRKYYICVLHFELYKTRKNLFFSGGKGMVQGISYISHFCFNQPWSRFFFTLFFPPNVFLAHFQIPGIFSFSIFCTRNRIESLFF